MGRKKSLRSKAAHFVSDLTTVFLNPISDKPSSESDAPRPENVTVSKEGQLEQVGEEQVAKDNPEDFVDGPDTSSFTAFLYSLLSSSEPVDDSTTEDQTNTDDRADHGEVSSDAAMKGPGGKKSLLSRGRQSLGRAFTKIVGSHSQDWRSNSDGKLNEDSNKDKFSGVELRNLMNSQEPEAVIPLPGISEPSLLLSEKTRSLLYASLPALVQGRKWLLLYSTWRHGISLSTLYRRSLLWPGLSLLVVGDRKGAIFGGLVEAPLRPTSKKYQGTNSTFVFTTTAGHPDIFRPTGANRYYTLCSTDFLAIGGGGHFAIYLDSDLLTGSSSSSETYGNPCLAHSQDFEVKEVELWGFVYASKYDEVLASSQTEEPGICRW